MTSMWPQPNVSWLTKPYWEATSRHVLTYPHCPKCKTNFFTPRVACPKCWNQDWQWAVSSGRGHIYSACKVSKAPLPGIEVPYVIAVVVLEEGWNMLSNIVNCDPDVPKAGMAVRVTFDRKAGEFTVPVFELDPARAPVKVQ